MANGVGEKEMTKGKAVKKALALVDDLISAAQSSGLSSERKAELDSWYEALEAVQETILTEEEKRYDK